ncbi:MAG: tetratricopeptide (TPR) repeat protein [Alcanivorax sp.]|jgi:tetratricopeptide (TPR) repeat protein
MSPKLSQDVLLRAEYIAKIRSGAGRDVLRRFNELPLEQAAQPAFMHVKALALVYCGSLESAVGLWESLYDEGLWSEELVAELASAYLALSRPLPAEELLSEWRETSGEPFSSALGDTLIEALLAQQDKSKSAAAAQLAEQITANKSPAQRLTQARAAVWLEDWSNVCQFLAPLDTDDNDLPGSAEVLRKNGYLAESLAILHHALSTDPSRVKTWCRLASTTWQLGDEDGAMSVLADAFEQFGEEPELLEAITRTCIDDRSYELAGLWQTRLENVVGQEDVRVRTLAAEVMLGLGDLQSVDDFLGGENDADESLDMARVSFYSRINRADVAIRYQDRIVAAKARSVESLLTRARLSAGAGRGSEVITLAQEVLECMPNSLAASALLVAHEPGEVELIHLNRLRQALYGRKMPARQRAWVSHALAEYYHAVKDYDLAGELYSMCNSLSEPAQELRYDSGKHSQWQSSITAAFQALDPSDSKLDEHDDVLPVFIVGVPRSGTTLTEQILSRHPEITGMGECQHVSLSFSWLMGQAAGADTMLSHSALAACTEANLEHIRKRFLALLRPHTAHLQTADRHLYLDKMPDNYRLIGWIFKLFPEAKIIYARRDPREIALSCWKANFGAINWAYRIEDIADRIVQHHRSMDVWLSMFGERMFVSEYADLVTEPEAQTQKMLGYLELDWNNVCLDHTQAPSIVRTASVNQVRQPVYQSSLRSWQHYENILLPAIIAFKESGLT